MSNVAVVFWSGTGNTEAMANAVVAGAEAAGASVTVVPVADFDEAAAAAYDGVALGCPAMGAEVLEESEFQPMWDAVGAALAGKKVAFFGSYGWGDGEWMRSWEEDAAAKGVTLACDSVICNDAPDDDAEAACKALGAAIA